MAVKVKKIKPSYVKDNGIWVLRLEELDLPKGFKFKERSLVYFPPGKIGGNHKHPREEVFLGLGKLKIVWLDSLGIAHSELMNPLGELKLFFVESNTPHVVKNISKNDFAVLIEFASGKQQGVVPFKVI